MDMSAKMKAVHRLADQCLVDASGDWEAATETLIKKARNLKQLIYVWACHRLITGAAGRVRDRIINGSGHCRTEAQNPHATPVAPSSQGGHTSAETQLTHASFGSPTVPARDANISGLMHYAYHGFYAFPLAGGKPLAEATKEDLEREVNIRIASARGAMRRGRWLRNISERLDREEQVKDRWTQEELQALWMGKRSHTSFETHTPTAPSLQSAAL